MARTKPRKRKRREEKYDTEDIEQFMVEEIDGVMGKEETENAPDEEKETENVDELAGIPIQPYDRKAQTGAIFILEKASLEVAKLGKFYQLLNSDHDKFLRNNNKNPADYRPDIAYQALNFGVTVQILLLKALLLQKLSITGVGESEKLLCVIKNPVTQYLPLNSRKIGFSYSSEKLLDIRDYVAAVSDDVNFVFVVGAMAHGKIDIKDFADDFISISGYPMSAVGCISRICGGLEHKWKIL